MSEKILAIIDEHIAEFEASITRLTASVEDPINTEGGREYDGRKIHGQRGAVYALRRLADAIPHATTTATTSPITFVGWGGKIESVTDDFDMGRGHYRNIPAYGIRRAFWDAACGYVNGFPKRAILYYVLTRSLNPVVCRAVLRREGVEFSDGFANVPLPPAYEGQ